MVLYLKGYVQKWITLLCPGEAAHENAQKTPDNFFVTVGDTN
jgi:hypothetical protein